MTIELSPVRIETGSPDVVGRMALLDGKLVALLVQLESSHDELAGHWSVEWLAGCALTCPPPFADLVGAENWIAEHLVFAPA